MDSEVITYDQEIIDILIKIKDILDVSLQISWHLINHEWTIQRSSPSQLGMISYADQQIIGHGATIKAAINDWINQIVISKKQKANTYQTNAIKTIMEAEALEGLKLDV